MNIHTYLKYIDNYNNLPDFVIFLPGSCYNKNKINKTLNTLKFKETKNSVFYVSKKKI